MEFHPNPMGDVGEGSITQHVICECVLADGEEEEAAPLGEGWCREVEDDGHQAADVEDAESLSVESSDGVKVGTTVCNSCWHFVGDVLELAVDGCVGGLETLASSSEGLFVAGDVVGKATALGSRSSRGVCAGLEGSSHLGGTTVGDVGGFLLETAILGSTLFISSTTDVGDA